MHSARYSLLIALFKGRTSFCSAWRSIARMQRTADPPGIYDVSLSPCMHTPLHDLPSGVLTTTLDSFVVITIHYISRGMEFSRARIIPQPADELTKWTFPMYIVER